MMRFRALSVNAGQTNAMPMLVWMVIGVIQEGSVNLTREERTFKPLPARVPSGDFPGGCTTPGFIPPT